MWVESLHLENFRNYNQAAIRFSPAQNLILGDNGQGKTNLLEAIYLLSHARSHRSSDDRELMLQTPLKALSDASLLSRMDSLEQDSPVWELPEQQWAKVTAMLRSDSGLGEGVLEVRIRIDAAGRLKTGFVWNGVTLKSRSAVLGHVPTVSFFLPDLLLLRGTPEDRRRWLDAAIVQYDPNHLPLLTEFLKIRQQKSRLLKAYFENPNPEHLRVWNTQFALSAARVIASRLSYLSSIAELTANQYRSLSDGAEGLSIAYKTNVCADALKLGTDPLPTVEKLHELLQQHLNDRMQDEIRRGTCLVGPHRDDISFFLDTLPAEAYGSQGQQRGIVLALKLAELIRLSEKLGEAPILLMDDVMAELDPKRQRLLLEHIQPGSQMFLTTTHSNTSWWERLQHALSSKPETLWSGTEIFKVTRGHVENLPPEKVAAFDRNEAVLQEQELVSGSVFGNE
jgi:DNA replication and repair protein RecF